MLVVFIIYIQFHRKENYSFSDALEYDQKKAKPDPKQSQKK